MSPTSNSGAPNSSLSPSGGGGGNQRNDSGGGGGGPGSRTFSSPDAHRPGSANNEPPISPHNLPSQFFFPPQGQPPQQQQPPMQPQQPPIAMKPSSPGSPGSVKSAKSNNNGSILERALASHVKQEGSQVEGGGGHNMMASWPPQQPQPPAHHLQYDLGSEVFMKPEIDISGLAEYDMHYR